MSQVVLIVPAGPGRRNDLAAAAHHLCELICNARVVELAPADPAADLETRGNRADFLVAAQPGSDDDKRSRLAFRAALFKTERPLLMLPPGGTTARFGRNVAIAWRDDARTLKAVVPALRLLGGAEEVHVLAGVRAGTPTPTMPPVLVEHGVPAMLHVLAIGTGPFGELLLSRARELGADLLIMGAQGHTRLREMLLGGVTSYVVAHAELPVLMRH